MPWNRDTAPCPGDEGVTCGYFDGYAHGWTNAGDTDEQCFQTPPKPIYRIEKPCDSIPNVSLGIISFVNTKYGIEALLKKPRTSSCRRVLVVVDVNIQREPH